MKCAVHNCTNKFKSRQKHSPQLSFFSFPKNQDILKKWLAFCRKNNRDKLTTNYLKSVICNEHFKEDDIQGGLQFQMGLCSKRTLRQGAVPCINKNDISAAEREQTEKQKNRQLVAELLEEAEAREAAEANGQITITPDYVRNTGIVTVPDFVSATAKDFFPTAHIGHSDEDPLAEGQTGIDLEEIEEEHITQEIPHRSNIQILTINTNINVDKRKCRTCSQHFEVDGNTKDLSNEENAVMLYHIEVITGIWVKNHNEVSMLMCPTCVENLRIAIDFREICIRTELLLTTGMDNVPPITDIIKVKTTPVEEDLQLIREYKDTDDIKQEAEQIQPIQIYTNSSNLVETFQRPLTNKILHPVAVDSRSLALGAQIYEDLLKEYKGQEKAPSSSKKHPKSQMVKEQIHRQGESEPKRIKRSREEKNRIRREQIRALPLNYVCDQCGASFRVRCNLTIHMLRHTRTKNFICPECPKKFYDAYMRNMHMRVRHRGELPFACNYCVKAFSSSNTRYLHEKNVHGALPRIHRNVNKLNQRLEAKNNIQIPNEQQQKQSVRYHCNYCDKSYATKYALSGHVNLHLGLKPFKCKICGMDFADAQSKKKHEVRHDSKRPFECDICLKGFYVRSKLREHERIHTGERPYRCNVCDAFFRYKFNLYSHQFSKMHKDNLQKLDNEKSL